MGGAPFDVVLVADPVHCWEAEEAIGLAGARLLDVLGWNEPDALMGQSLGRPVLVLEAEGAGAGLAAGLLHVAAMVDAFDLAVVATLAREQIDEVAAALMGANVQLLCEPSLAERVAALAVAAQLTGRVSLSDRWREGEAERLSRVNQEIARIAELLMRLAANEPGGCGPSDISDRNSGYSHQPSFTLPDPQLVRQAIRARRLRDAFLGNDLFEDPAWDMLLDLYAAHLEGGRVSVSSLCIAAAVAPTTALRWIAKLTDAGLFERHPDPADRRRAFIALSPKALQGMGAYVDAVQRAGLPVA